MRAAPLHVAVLGGGTMGGDIGCAFAAAGHAVRVVEPDAATRAALPARAAAVCGGRSPGALAVVRAFEDLDWPRIDWVIESVPEQLELKRTLLAAVERLARADALISTNTSSLRIADIAAGLRDASRLAGVHFMVPAHRVPLVEVIAGDAPAAAVADIESILQAMGKRPIRVEHDLPGFVVNRLQHALMREAFALVDAGVATPEAIDTAVRYGFGFRYLACGPMLQKELGGWDAHARAAAALYPGLAANREPGATLRALVDQGRFGAKSGEGLWAWTAVERATTERAADAVHVRALRLLDEARDQVPPPRRRG